MALEAKKNKRAEPGQIDDVAEGGIGIHKIAKALTYALA
jgi:hypothetical protein